MSRDLLRGVVLVVLLTVTSSAALWWAATYLSGRERMVFGLLAFFFLYVGLNHISPDHLNGGEP